MVVNAVKAQQVVLPTISTTIYYYILYLLVDNKCITCRFIASLNSSLLFYKVEMVLNLISNVSEVG